MTTEGGRIPHCITNAKYVLSSKKRHLPLIEPDFVRTSHICGRGCSTSGRRPYPSHRHPACRLCFIACLSSDASQCHALAASLLDKFGTKIKAASTTTQAIQAESPSPNRSPARTTHTEPLCHRPHYLRQHALAHTPCISRSSEGAASCARCSPDRHRQICGLSPVFNAISNNAII